MKNLIELTWRETQLLSDETRKLLEPFRTKISTRFEGMTIAQLAKIEREVKEDMESAAIGARIDHATDEY